MISREEEEEKEASGERLRCVEVMAAAAVASRRLGRWRFRLCAFVGSLAMCGDVEATLDEETADRRRKGRAKRFVRFVRSRMMRTR